MNKKKNKVNEFDQFKKWFLKKVDDVKDEMFLDHFSLSVKFHKRQATFDGKNFIMNYRYSRAYKEAVLQVNYDVFEMYLANDNENRKKIVDGLIHELCHTHTIPLSDLCVKRFLTEREIEEEAENTTETMAQYVRSMIELKNEKIFYN